MGDVTSSCLCFLEHFMYVHDDLVGCLWTSRPFMHIHRTESRLLIKPIFVCASRKTWLTAPALLRWPSNGVTAWKAVPQPSIPEL